MFVVIVERVVKINTGTQEKYAPRTANQTRLTVSGPFGTLRGAERAVAAALTTHTCLAAQVWSACQVAAEIAKGYGTIGEARMSAMVAAQRCIDSAA